jgi:Holliday junction resolvase RusA-like endonuclease
MIEEEIGPALRRDDFIGQFALTLNVQCLRSWPKRRNEAPLFLSACLREWIAVAGGRMKIAEADFTALAQAVIADMYRTTPKGQRPDADAFAGRLYDALSHAGVAVTRQVRRSSMR